MSLALEFAIGTMNLLAVGDAITASDVDACRAQAIVSHCANSLGHVGTVALIDSTRYFRFGIIVVAMKIPANEWADDFL